MVIGRRGGRPTLAYRRVKIRADPLYLLSQKRVNTCMNMQIDLERKSYSVRICQNCRELSNQGDSGVRRFMKTRAYAQIKCDTGGGQPSGHLSGIV